MLVLIATVLFLRADLPTSARIALTLFFAGGLGNLFDRIATGRVVDFLLVRVGFLHTGVFNVADMAIMCGIVPLFLGGAFGDRSRSTREDESRG